MCRRQRRRRLNTPPMPQRRMIDAFSHPLVSDQGLRTKEIFKCMQATMKYCRRISVQEIIDNKVHIFA